MSRLHCQRLFALLLSISGAPVLSAAPTTTPLVVESGGVRLYAGSPWRTHLRTEVDGLPFIDSSTLYASRPQVGGRYYGYEDDPAIVRDALVQRSADGAVTVSLPLRAPRGEFVGTQTMELLPERRLRLVVDARLTSGVAGVYEHRIGGIFTGWLQGRPYKATLTNGRTTSGILPLAPHTDDPAGSTILSDIRTLRIETPAGPLELTTSGNQPLSLLDYRMNRFFEGQPLFWLGVPERPLPPDARISYEVVMQFPPRKSSPAGPTVHGRQLPQPMQAVYEPQPQPDVVVPTPKEIAWKDGLLRLPEPVGIQLESAPEDQESLSALAEEMGTELRTRYRRSAETTGSAGTIVLRKKGRPEGSSADRPEEYRLRVGERAEIEAETTAGLVAGLKTLHQLLRSDEDGLAIRRCDIHDWPSLPFRGVHFFSGAGGTETQRKMIREVVGPLKLNAVVYHCDNIQWETHPEIRKPGAGMPKEDARLVAAEADRHHVGMIPLMNTFGHSNWFLENDTWRHLADNPANPFAYNPLKPEVYRLVHDLYQEAVDLFHPAYFHIGHDEITLKGFPLDPELQKIGARKLILDDIRHYRDWFAARGIRTMIWGDMFLGPGEANDFTLAPTVEEARLRRAGLPRDLVITDWHYTVDPPARYKSLRVFNEDGFDTIASSWYHSKNIVHFARAAAEARADAVSTAPGSTRRGESLGLLETTWAGYNLNEKAVQQQPDQFAAYVLTAEAAWTGGAKSPDALGFDHRQLFAKIWNRDRLPNGRSAGWTTDLTALANYEIRGVEREENPAKAARFGEFRFGAPCNAGSPRGALLAARFNPSGNYPERVVLPIETTASAVMFALGSTYGGPAEPAIALTTVTFDDGTTEGIEWKLGQNVLALDDRRAAPGAMILEELRMEEGRPAQTIHGHLWTNPYTDRNIRTIDFVSTGQGSGLVIFGVSGLQ